VSDFGFHSDFGFLHPASNLNRPRRSGCWQSMHALEFLKYLN
jgi:hypothetical protein